MQVDTFNSRQLLAAGQLEEALKFLSNSALPGAFRNELILMNGQWEESERSFTQNLIDYQEHSRERSRLTVGLLDFLDRMEADFLKDSALDHKLYFYESGVPLVPKEDRKYVDVFDQATTRYVYWELRLIHPKSITRLEFDLAYEIFRPDQTLLTHMGSRRAIEAGWANSYFTNGWGSENAGTYHQEGKYTVKKFLNGQQIAEGQFTIKK